MPHAAPLSRFPKSVDNVDQANHYFSGRALQLLHAGYAWSPQDTRDVFDARGENWGCVTKLRDVERGRDYQSLYVYKNFTGQGRYREFAEARRKDGGDPLVTVADCHIESYLKKIGLVEGEDYVVERGMLETPEYQAAQRFYGDGRARRSGVYFMNHVDEGLFVLKRIGASEAAMRAYCLHPLFQGAADLKESFEKFDLRSVAPDVLALAMEYRNVANAYLSRRSLDDLHDAKLSPLKDVNDMLVADKIQNWKDFILYHRDTHPRAVELENYFINWLKLLGIDFATSREIMTQILFRTAAQDDQTRDAAARLTLPVIAAAQVALLRDSESGIQVYLQKRHPALSLYPGLWSLLGGRVDPEEVVRRTAMRETLEESGVALRPSALVKAGSGAIARPDSRLTVEQFAADANALFPSLVSPQEAVAEAWILLGAAAYAASGPGSDAGTTPLALHFLKELAALETGGARTVNDLLARLEAADHARSLDGPLSRFL